MAGRAIVVRGARQNNLQGLDLDLPSYRLVAVSGVSGSGKSSLAFDTLFAEGQRRFIETFSAYARQFLERLDRPRVERIENIPPAIAVDRKNPVRTSRSTVGTMTEVADYLKLLFARRARLHCDSCGQPVCPASPADVQRAAAAFPAGTRLLITFPAPADAVAIERLRQAGFDRLWSGGEVLPLEAFRAHHGEKVDVLVDRFVAGGQMSARVADAAEQAFRQGQGRADLWTAAGEKLSFSRLLECPRCGREYSPPQVNLFSSNSPLGACPRCRGFGRIIDIDWEAVVPDPTLTLEEGAIKPYGAPGERRPEFRELKALCRDEGIPLDVPWRELAPGQRRKIIEGTPEHFGLRQFFAWVESKSYQMHMRVYLSRYRAYRVCPDCRGGRFRPEALRYRLGGMNIAEVSALTVEEARRFFANLEIAFPDEAAHLLLEELKRRLDALAQVGLGYLTLDRQSRTLSGGEVQRVSLAAALGSALSETLLVLDEPSVGLHPRDTERLAAMLRRLRDLGNTVLLVEHDPGLLAAADLLLELGPGAGAAGGRLIEFAPPAAAGHGLTAAYLQGRRRVPLPPARREPPAEGGWLQVRGARANNLRDLDVRIPLGRLVCLTGVSGSGKSTLLEQVLYPGLNRLLGRVKGEGGEGAIIDGADSLTRVELVDQRPLGRTPRANPASYCGALSEMRRLLAGTEAALRLGLGPGAFSFNVRGGRCEACRGEGFEKIEMQFLSDVYVTCPECQGKRFGPAVLGVRWREKNIAEMLELTVTEALEFFRGQRALLKALGPLARAGLGYLRLGQPLNTLSGGEAQRLKLSEHLQARAGRTLFLLDEPTTGLHLHDLEPLLAVLRALVDAGHSVLAIEHNLEFIKAADWIIDLGPEGGAEGGRIVAEGPPEKIAAAAGSHTGRFLRQLLAGRYWIRPAASSDRVAEKAEAATPLISVRGAREHNLKNVSLDIPRGKLVAVSGVSGSGKSSLIFDVLFAEGQRRYLECLAPYARQYLRVLPRPDVDALRGLPPTVAIEQRASLAGRRSTVATLTEIAHYLRLLFARLGKPHCVRCGHELQTPSRQGLIERVLAAAREPARLLYPAVSARKGSYRRLFEDLLRQGIGEARIDGELCELHDGLELERYRPHTIEPVIGRLPAAGGRRLVEKAVEAGQGTVILLGRSGQEAVFSLRGVCPFCGASVPPPDPLLFSFNTERGACPRCQGLGEVGERQRRRCPECGGGRLRAEALVYRLGGKNIHQVGEMNPAETKAWLDELHVEPRWQGVLEPLRAEIRVRLQALERLGLGYLALNRGGDTLSGGEAQRVRLACQLGSNLSGACYVLDEPTIGLHPRDTRLLIEALRRLCERGNTVLVVEHDLEMLRAADRLIDLGPGGGDGGGQVIAQGRPDEVMQSPLSATGAVMREGKRCWRKRVRPPAEEWLRIFGARRHNLKEIDVALPLQRLVCVSGVSGSGKSSLVVETLLPCLEARLASRPLPPGLCRALEGGQKLARARWVDHQPIGRTPRSTPATYLGIWSEVRTLLAATEQARALGYGPARFSFNTASGQCPVCRGQGLVREEMAFLPDVFTPCEQCAGRRFNAETLRVTFGGLDAAEILELTFQQALSFFRAMPRLRRPMEFVADIGLGYLKLGQPSPRLSGGEAQRLKLARELAFPSRLPTLFVLDEPTTGLHLQDVRRLLKVLHALVDTGHSVVVIEHNLEVIKDADWVIDLGPEGGEGGGRVVAEGTPAELLQAATVSHTARALREYLADPHSSTLQ